MGENCLSRSAETGETQIQSDLLAIIPAYNEQANIVRVIRDVQDELPAADILVVNDGSVDRTAEAARSFAGVKVIDLPCNLFQLRSPSACPYKHFLQ